MLSPNHKNTLTVGREPWKCEEGTSAQDQPAMISYPVDDRQRGYIVVQRNGKSDPLRRSGKEIQKFFTLTLHIGRLFVLRKENIRKENKRREQDHGGGCDYE